MVISLSIGTLYYSQSTDRGQAEFTSMPFHDASITHNRDKASSMTFKSTVKLDESDRIIYQNLDSKKKFGGQVIKRSKTLGDAYNYEVMDYTRLYHSKVTKSFSNMTSSAILKQLLKNDLNNLSTSGIQETNIIHSYLKWDNAKLWDIIEQLAWLEYQAGNYIYYDIDYTGTLIWKSIPANTTGYVFTEAYDYSEEHDSSDIITRGILLNSNKPSENVVATASSEMIAKWGYITEIETCTPPSSNKTTDNKNCKTTSKTENSYWNKCGLSPDKKTIVSVAKPSGPDAGKYSYKLYRTVFQNYCPICKKSGGLRFDGGKKTKCIDSAVPSYGHAWKDDVQNEHEITCIKCDSDYCGVTGAEKWNPIRGRLKTVKKPVSSNQKQYNLLTSGKLPYSKESKSSKCDTQAVSSLKNEKNIQKYNIPASVWKVAVEITNPKQSELKNAKAIFNYVKNNTSYEGYSNTKYGAAGTLKRKKGNCTDHGHLVCALCRSVGIKCNYIHNHCIHHVYNKIYINGKGVIVDTGRRNPTWGSHWGSSGCPVEKETLDF